MAMLALRMMVGNIEVGTIRYDTQQDSFALTYSDAWQESGYALSPHLPFESACDSGAIRSFLSNLLPEGEALEELLRRNMLSRNNVYGLVSAIGEDATGAVRFVSEDSSAQSGTLRPVSPEELAQRIKERETRSIAVWDKRYRLSVAGVQSKLAVHMDGKANIALAEGDLASTHIFKFGVNRHEHLVLNEYVCLGFAKAMGLSVVEVDLVYFSERVLSVKRFDRVVQGEHIIRRHIIDGCQLSNVKPDLKYERNLGSGRDVAHVREGVSFKTLFDAANKTKVPLTTKNELLQWMMVNLILGNADAHGKNVSFFVDQEGITLAPFYDIVAVACYEQYDNELSMAIGDQFSFNELVAYDFIELAEELGINKTIIKRTMTKACAAGRKALASHQAKLDDFQWLEELTSDELDFVKKLHELFASRLSVLETIAKLL